MIELITTVIITLGSVAMFVYWFRFTCLLLLNAKTTRDYAMDVAMAHQLSFHRVHAAIREGASADLDQLHAALDRDYAQLKHLIAQAGGAQVGIEDRMLQFNYRVTAAWYRTSRNFSPTAARRALDEMCQMVAHFANVTGEQAAAAA